MSTSKKSGLGRGLGSLIPSAPAVAMAAPVAVVETVQTVTEAVVQETVAADGSRVLQIPVDKVTPNPFQPRTVFGHQELEDLMLSIKEHGILMPLIVTSLGEGRYEIVAGERRYRAAKMVGLATVPAIVRDADMEKKLVLALIENIQRENLNALEEAKAYKHLTQEYGMTQDEVARQVGKARPTVANMMRLLDLPEEIKNAIASGTLQPSTARAILGLPTPDAQLKFFHKMEHGKVPTAEVERRVRDEVVGSGDAKVPRIAALEEQLRDVLGARVDIKKKASGIGSIVISFYSEGEMQSVVKKLMTVQEEWEE